MTGAPDLVIEIGSPSTRRRDETIKRRLYERFGVVEYWIVDPDIDAVRVHRAKDGHFGRAIELSAEAGDVLSISKNEVADIVAQGRATVAGMLSKHRQFSGARQSELC